jgi:hypothetical protein
MIIKHYSDHGCTKVRDTALPNMLSLIQGLSGRRWLQLHDITSQPECFRLDIEWKKG